MRKGTRKKGDKGEDHAAFYLAQHGFKILERNWYYHHKEIDIIATKNKKIIFVEVKSRNPEVMESPNEAISRGKIKNIVDAAEAYIIEKDICLEARFDVMMILFDQGKPKINHIIDAFSSPVY